MSSLPRLRLLRPPLQVKFSCCEFGSLSKWPHVAGFPGAYVSVGDEAPLSPSAKTPTPSQILKLWVQRSPSPPSCGGTNRQVRPGPWGSPDPGHSALNQHSWQTRARRPPDSGFLGKVSPAPRSPSRATARVTKPRCTGPPGCHPLHLPRGSRPITSTGGIRRAWGTKSADVSSGVPALTVSSYYRHSAP